MQIHAYGVIKTQIIDLKMTKAPLEPFWIITQLYLETGSLPAMESRLACVVFSW